MENLEITQENGMQKILHETRIAEMSAGLYKIIVTQTGERSYRIRISSSEMRHSWDLETRRNSRFVTSSPDIPIPGFVKKGLCLLNFKNL